MKAICSLLFSFFSFVAYAQDNYPVPDETTTRLFYIQHSKNHNTYVYDAKMDGISINKKEPIDQYRIVYTDGGVKKPLTAIQRDLAYGMKTKYKGPDLFEMHLAGAKKYKLYLTLNSDGKPQIDITINSHKIYLDRVFVKLKEGSSGVNIKTEYILFVGKDFTTVKNVTEKLYLK